MTIYSLSYLTVGLADPAEAVRTAAAAGYQAVGLRAAPAGPGGPFSPLVGNSHLIRDVTRACAEEGIRVLDLEIIRIGADFAAAAYAPLLDLAQRLGVSSVTVACDDTVEARAVDNFGALCALAATFDTHCALEYMPRTGAASLRAGLRIVTALNSECARLLFDPLHTARTFSSPSDIAAIPPEFLDYLQLCDAPAEIPESAEGLLHTARMERLLPGEGGIDLKAMFRQLPANLPISVEVPSVSRLERLGALAWARQALSASQAFMRGLTLNAASSS